MTRYRWVAARKAEGFPITMACAVADVSRQAFGDWRARQQKARPSPAERAEGDLVEEIRRSTPSSTASTASLGSPPSWPGGVGW